MGTSREGRGASGPQVTNGPNPCQRLDWCRAKRNAQGAKNRADSRNIGLWRIVRPCRSPVSHPAAQRPISSRNPNPVATLGLWISSVLSLLCRAIGRSYTPLAPEQSGGTSHPGTGGAAGPEGAVSGSDAPFSTVVDRLVENPNIGTEARGGHGRGGAFARRKLGTISSDAAPARDAGHLANLV